MENKFTDDETKYKYILRQIDINCIYGTLIVEYIFITIWLLCWWFNSESKLLYLVIAGFISCGLSCCLIWFTSYRDSNSAFRKQLSQTEPWWKLKEYGGYV